MEKNDWIGIIAVLLMMIGGILVSYYFITQEIHKCTSDPVKYSINKLLEDNLFSNNFTVIRIEIYEHERDIIPLDVIEYNVLTGKRT
jgi:hypothetical protein